MALTKCFLQDKGVILEKMSPVLTFRNIKYPLGSSAVRVRRFFSRGGKKRREKPCLPGKGLKIAGALCGTVFRKASFGMSEGTPPWKRDLQASVASKKGGFGKGGGTF